SRCSERTVRPANKILLFDGGAACDHRFLFNNRSSSLAGNTPDCRHLMAPFLNIISVGTPRIWYCPASCGFLSTSILIIAAVSPMRCFTSSRMGACIWQGPHHVAKKSTKTGLSPLINSWNVLISGSVNFFVFNIGFAGWFVPRRAYRTAASTTPYVEQRQRSECTSH